MRALAERLSDYSAGGRTGYSQRYRLAPGAVEGPLVEVDLVLRQRAASLPRPSKPSGPPVHPWLVESYRALSLDVPAVLRELCASVGLPELSTVAEVSAALEALPQAAQSASRVAECRSRLRMVERWAGRSATRHHKLRRDAKVWRLHSPLTELPSSIRRHLRLDGESVATLDIRACGLALRAAQMRAEGATADRDVAAVCDMIEDTTRDPYVEFFRVVHKREPTSCERDTFKHDLLAELWFASIETQLRSEIGRAVRDAYPGFHTYLLNRKREHGHAELANATMRLESTLIVDRLAVAFASASVRLATVHDCVYVRASGAEQACALFAGVLRECGVRAALTVSAPVVT